MSDELTIKGAVNDWYQVEQDGEHIGYVAIVKIAGCDVSFRYASDQMTIVCDEWSIERDSHPVLLIEAPSWYSPKREEGGSNE